MPGTDDRSGFSWEGAGFSPVNGAGFSPVNGTGFSPYINRKK